ncbi:MAG: glycosyltransferase [bacterium]|nr:glycosyltransferase [bacterium]
MKIAHVIDSGGLYGAERVILDLMAEQTAAGEDPLLVSVGESSDPEKPIERAARAEGLEVQAVRMRRGLNRAGSLRLRRSLEAWGADVVHGHGYKPSIQLGLIAGRGRGYRLLTTLHGWTEISGWSRLRTYQWLETLACRRLDAVVVVDGGMLESSSFAACRSRMVEIPNGIADPSDGRDPAVDEESRGGFCVGAVGRLSPEKGLHDLVESIARVRVRAPDIRLLLAGEGPEREGLERRIASHSLDAHFAGYVTPSAAVLSQLSVLALPSYTEGLPIVLLEAMFLGVPIVASSVGAVPRVLDDGRCGLLVTAGDPGALDAAILSVLDDPDAAHARCEAARARASEHYSRRVMAQRYSALYRDLLQRAGSSR